MKRRTVAVFLLVACAGCARQKPSASGRVRASAPPARPFLAFVSVAAADTFHKVSLAALGSLREAYVLLPP